jgi:hypothetical protein
MNSAEAAQGGASWYVTNGHAVVGPIGTDLLLRGVASARIPDGCRVAQPTWSAWRDLREVRELSAGWRTPMWANVAHDLAGTGVAADLVRCAPDAGEALLYAMHAAVTATRATAGLVHRARDPFIGLVTSSAHGPGGDDQLGNVIAYHDAAYDRACAREAVVGAPCDDAATRTIARRFSDAGAQLAGVAMVPVYDGHTLLAMIELGRVDHPFRAGDAEVLARIAEIVSAR